MTYSKYIDEVLQKIYNLYEDGADFKQTRWIFNWNDVDSNEKNVDSALQEIDSLNYLSSKGIINIKLEENPQFHLRRDMADSKTFQGYREINSGIYKKFWKSSDYKISKIKIFNPKADKAWAGFDYAAWITKFDIDKFKLECENRSLFLLNETVKGNLIISFGTVSVKFGNKSIRLQQLSESSRTQKILEYCKENQGRKILAEEIKDKASTSNFKYLTSVLENNKFFNRNNGLLKDFIEIDKRSILLRTEAYVSRENYDAIIKSSIKS